MNIRFYTFLALILTILLSFSAVKADNIAESSAFVCLEKIQKNIFPNNYIQIRDFKNYTYSGYFKGIDYKQNKFTFLRDEPGIDATMKSMLIDDISQIIVQKEKLDIGNVRRWTIGGIFAGFSVAAIKVVIDDKKVGYQRSDSKLSDFIIPAVVGAGIGAFIGLVTGGRVTVSQTITCKE